MAERVESQDSQTRKEKLTKAAIGIVCLVVATTVLYFNYGGTRTFRSDQRLYSDDDGKTWFVDSADNIPPYTRNGKTAYGAVVYSYAGGSKQFCGYLVRFPEKVKLQIMEAAASGSKSVPPVSVAKLAWSTELNQAIEIKAPMKSGPWISIQSKDARSVLDVHAPDGSELDQVMP